MNSVAEVADLAPIMQTLVTRALACGSVCRTELDDGITLFAYPSETEILIGIGIHRDNLNVYTIETALSRRFASPRRYACWLPALFADGGFYVMQRRDASTVGGVHGPSTEEISDALALFAA